MKPNVIVIQPSHHGADPAIDRFCEALAETRYVYLIRPLTTFREDSPAGVRFLNFSPERLPGFGEVESVIVVDGSELAGRLLEAYPAARHWHLNGDAGGHFPLSRITLSDTIVDGEFGPPSYPECARAV